jgi:hypothetical protein
LVTVTVLSVVFVIQFREDRSTPVFPMQVITLLSGKLSYEGIVNTIIISCWKFKGTNEIV